MSAETLRRAAALMRERAEAATPGPWEFRPRRGFQSVSDSPATIGFVDTAGYFVMLREGMWATENDMSYVASWHPAVALAVADWLDATAARIDAGRDPQHGGRRNHSWRGSREALAVARAYLGET